MVTRHEADGNDRCDSERHVHLDLAATGSPLVLADLHRELAVDATIVCDAVASTASDTPDGADAPDARRLDDVVEGAGFEIVESSASPPPLDDPRATRLVLRRNLTLADTVGPNMTMLICGLNPSIYSAEVGIGFGRPGNRFWPAALNAGIVSRDRDPRHALTGHGVGMTDIVKRATRKAAELDRDEFRAGLDRVERLVSWLEPAVVCFVGLSGWRAVIDRKAIAGWQQQRLGGRPTYLMPSTSGLNASSQLPDLTDHLCTAALAAQNAS